MENGRSLSTPIYQIFWIGPEEEDDSSDLDGTYHQRIIESTFQVETQTRLDIFILVTVFAGTQSFTTL